MLLAAEFFRKFVLFSEAGQWLTAAEVRLSMCTRPEDISSTPPPPPAPEPESLEARWQELKAARGLQCPAMDELLTFTGVMINTTL